MLYQEFSALVILAAASLFTPGPNNALLANSGANFGLARSLPHIFGVAWGFTILVVVIGLFLVNAFEQFPWLEPAIKVIGFGVLIYIAVQIARSDGGAAGAARRRPFTFMEAVAFQWVNPKGWAMALAVCSQFVTVEGTYLRLIIIVGVYGVLGMGSATSWTALGYSISGWLEIGQRRRKFNLATAFVLVLSAVLLFMG